VGVCTLSDVILDLGCRSMETTLIFPSHLEQDDGMGCTLLELCPLHISSTRAWGMEEPQNGPVTEFNANDTELNRGSYLL
jgi:hypothetical protein